MADDRLLTNCY